MWNPCSLGLGCKIHWATNSSQLRGGGPEVHVSSSLQTRSGVEQEGTASPWHFGKTKLFPTPSKLSRNQISYPGSVSTKDFYVGRLPLPAGNNGCHQLPFAIWHRQPPKARTGPSRAYRKQSCKTLPRVWSGTLGFFQRKYFPYQRSMFIPFLHVPRNMWAEMKRNSPCPQATLQESLP